MAEKDITEKILESYNDVFADIVNGLLFNGKEVLKPNQLVEQDPRSAYKADGKVRDIERDVAKRWKKQNIRIACIGLENQTDIDPDMPLRVIGYDGAEYRAQLNADRTDETKGADGQEKAKRKKRKPRYPVVTLVLYFGKRRWNKPLNLLDCLKLPEEFRPFVNDYRINLFEVAYLTDEQIKLFRSDFRIVAEYFVKTRKNKNYKPEMQEMKYAKELLQLLSVMTQDHRFEESYNMDGKGAPKYMCEVLDRIEDKGIAKGRAEGRAEGIVEGRVEGRAEGAKQTAQNLYKMGLDVKKIAKAVGYGVDTVRDWLGLLPA